MTATADPTANTAPKKKSKLPLILGIVFAILGGAGGFFAVKLGFIGEQAPQAASTEDLQGNTLAPLPPVAFLALDPLVVNLPNQSGQQLLRFTAQLEVPPQYLTEVEAIKPRIVDVLNGYLRAVEIADLEDPAILLRLRAQMLRRVQVVTGEGRVRDLLIMEFVLN